MPVQEREWENRVKRMLKAELTRKGVTYSQLVGMLADQGVMDSEPNIRNKISRGKFTAVFLIQCLTAIGVSEVRIRSEEHTSELQSLMRISYAVFCLKQQTYNIRHTKQPQT